MACNESYRDGALSERWSNGSQAGEPAAGYTKFNPDGSVQTQRALTGAEAQALTDQDAGQALVSNGAALRSKAQSALTTNATFLGLTSPSSAQVTAQVKALTKEANALIRLAIGQFDDISGT